MIKRYVVEIAKDHAWRLHNVIILDICGEVTPIRMHNFVQGWLDFIARYYPSGNYRIRRFTNQ